MTQATAKKIFDILLSWLRSHGFIDIGTFLIKEVQKNDEYIEFDEKYEYNDTENAIALLEAESRLPQNALYALNRLLNASIEYFETAQQIPNKYSNRMRNLMETQDFTDVIEMETIGGESINISELMKNDSINDLITLLYRTREGLEMDDDAFLNSI